MTENEEKRWIRIFIFVGAVICGVMAQCLPTIVLMFTWIYSFMIPVGFLYLFGFWWKRSLKVGMTAFLGSWIIANIWTFFPALPEAIGLGNVHIAYVITVISAAVMVIGNLITKGKPGYFKSDEWFESEAYRIYLEEKAAGNA